MNVAFNRTDLSIFDGHNGWGGRDRTCESRDQNPLPYHLATPQSSATRTYRITCPLCNARLRIFENESPPVAISQEPNQPTEQPKLRNLPPRLPARAFKTRYAIGAAVLSLLLARSLGLLVKMSSMDAPIPTRTAAERLDRAPAS